jgi:hypothetical protein
MPKPNHICLHAFFEDANGNQTYTDGLEYPATGWSVYDFYEGQHRTSSPLWGGQIDIDDEEDFETYEDARCEAYRRGRLYGVEVEEY